MTDSPTSPDEHAITTEAHEVPVSALTPDAVTGGDILVEVMRAAGVEVAFGVISIHNLPLVEAVDRELRFVPVRHEAAAINAADGYARATGGIGVAITSTGTGAGNAAGAMLEALTAQSPVLHVTGNINAELIGEGKGAYHEVPRQLAMLQSVSSHAMRIETARQPRAVLTDALRLLRTAPTGPVSVDWPIDLQYTADPEAQNKIDERDPQPRAGARRDLERAAAVLQEARRPLIWAGGGARRVGPTLVALAEAWGAGVLTGANGRGSIPEDHPLCIGNFAADEALADLLADADCLLTIGSHLRGNETRNFELPLPATHVQIDVDPDALGRNYPVSVGLHADARVVVPALLEALGEAEIPGTDDDWGARVAQAAAAARKSHRKDIGAYAQICDSLRKRLPRRSPIVRDVSIPGSSWGNRLLAVFDPTDNLYAAGGGIGQGLAMAIGAAVGRPDQPVLAMIGDGGLAVHLGELAVLAAERPDVVVVLFNDGGYGVLRNMQTAAHRPQRAVDLHTPDFERLAESFGLKHRHVASAEDFDKALKKALKKGGPSILEIDVTALRPRPADLVPPAEVP
ncbi:thiamine pyrophosphate-binding protein [Granulicoccus sp. GXG6511]|uniref:thiamine pyrophosphate-binding protein n=1 Tax=Granulicoccus sp. GXG6511 TaxID=3381351 RepID=UPI003D7E29B7